jgi:hypothetical protein
VKTSRPHPLLAAAFVLVVASVWAVHSEGTTTSTGADTPGSASVVRVPPFPPIKSVSYKPCYDHGILTAELGSLDRVIGSGECPYRWCAAGNQARRAAAGR